MQIRQIIISSSLIKIIGKEHDFLQNFPYILWRIMHEIISIKNKSCKVLFLSFILIASRAHYMYAKFYEVWTIIF